MNNKQVSCQGELRSQEAEASAEVRAEKIVAQQGSDRRAWEVLGLCASAAPVLPSLSQVALEETSEAQKELSDDISVCPVYTKIRT